MHPILFELGPIKLYSYGLSMAIAFWVAIHFSMRRAKSYGLKPEVVSNLSMVIIVAGLVGGRAAYLLIEESVEQLFSLQFFQVWDGGMVFYGGFIAAVLATFVFALKHRLSFLDLADVCTPALALAHAIGRIGCLLAGCCYGKVCELPWAITFTNPLSLAPQNVALHPTQIYESLANFVLAGLLVLSEKRPMFRGQTFTVYLVLYAVIRSTVEVFRGDVERGFVTFGGVYPNEWLSTSTFISIALVSIAIAMFLVNRKRPSILAR